MATLRRIYRLPPELEDTLVADLWLAGTLGVMTEQEADGCLRVTAWTQGDARLRPPSPWSAFFGGFG